MVLAIISLHKTHTRRVVMVPRRLAGISTPGHAGVDFGCPYGQPGDRLWVRETWCQTDRSDGTPVIAYRAGGCIAIGRDGPNKPDYLIRDYAWDETPYTDAWRPSIFMPRWASRLTLEITGVCVERLQDINAGAAQSEGITPYEGGWTNGLLGPFSDPVLAFSDLWNSINAARGYGWDANPLVWVIAFRRLEAA
jgi:hypothetical protein